MARAAEGVVTVAKRDFVRGLILALAVGTFGVSSGHVRRQYSMNSGDDHQPSLSQRGRVYQLGRHRLMCGDATCAEDVAELMAGKTADMVFTDPPYNVGYIGKSKKALRIQNDALKADKFRELLERSFALQYQHSRPGAPIYVCHAALRTDAFASALATTGWHIAQCIVWSKHHFVLGRSDYHWKHEPILYGWKPGAPHPWYSDRKQTTVWNFKRPLRNRDHPTMKPVDLVSYAIGNSSAPGNIVLDTFAGGGSTLVACEQTDRTAYVMELDPRYCDVIRNRYAEQRGRDITTARRRAHRSDA